MKETTTVVVDGKTLHLSNLSKLMYPETGFTKSHMIDYYIRIAPVLLPHLKDRPITLKRYPDGINGQYFYEKRAPSHTPDWVKKAVVERRNEKPSIEAILINDLPTLVWSANLANLELHTPLAKVPQLDRPSMVVFDLDPGPPAGVIDCAQVALWLKELLDSLKLESFGKTSGSKGMQIYVPLNTPADYEQTRGFAKEIAELLRREHPDRVIVEMNKQLRAGKVFIDYSQNAGRKTTISVYSLRATHRTPNCSTPVTWEEIARRVKKEDPQALFFEPSGVLQRVKKHGDLFAPLLKLKQKLPHLPLERKDTGLRTYNVKRNFGRTSEPRGNLSDKIQLTSGLLFVIQKHQARHLHYDFRMEMEGVLRSWAVPKGIPTEKEDTRLAIHVEDHPMDYAKFEGIIPKGNYGAGTVMVWDTGKYTVKDKHPVEAYRSKKISMTLNGRKLKGEWALFQVGRKEEENRWLLMKKVESIPPLSTKEDDRSVLTGRSMKQISKEHDAEWISSPPEVNLPEELLKRIAKYSAGAPQFVDPMQSKSVNALPEGDNWLYEVKLDGYRALAIKRSGRFELLSRHAKDLVKKYPEILEGLKRVAGNSFVLDGEIVALDENGLPSLRLLESSAGRPDRFICYYAFDLLHLNGKDLRRMPLTGRKEILEAILPGDMIRYTVGLEADPEVIVREVRRRGLEGIVAKKKTSRYAAGKRSGEWVKFKIPKGLRKNMKGQSIRMRG